MKETSPRDRYYQLKKEREKVTEMRNDANNCQLLSTSFFTMDGLAHLEELPKKLEDLKKRSQEESEEAARRRRRRRQQGCPRILSVACGIAMVTIG